MTDSRSLTRRELLAGAALAAVSSGEARAAAPVSPVSLTRCRSYDGDLVSVVAKAFDQIGGIGSLVRGKTITMKLNITGGPRTRFAGLLPGATHWVHPNLVGAACAAFGKAGAKRIRLVESCGGRVIPMEEYVLDAGWDVKAIRAAAPQVEFINTANAGPGGKYGRLKVSNKPYIYPGFDLNSAYSDTDVFVSMSKLKDHEECGITLSLKNCFGNTPTSIYGDDAGADEPNEKPRGGRETVLHYGKRQPSKSAPQEVNFASDRYEGYRVPRIVCDLVGARPIQLNIVDGITTCVGGEGPWVRGSKPANPGVLIIGRNPISTDTVAMAVMGYDPRAKSGQTPFTIRKPGAQEPDKGEKHADNILLLAEAAGIGGAELSRIDVRGAKVKEVVFDFDGFRLGKQG